MTSPSSLISRLWRRDASLWKPLSRRSEISNRLGWLDAPERARAIVPGFTAFADALRRDGVRSVVLLGMGGSSLAPLVFRSVFGKRPGFPDLIVLDTTDADTVRAARAKLRIPETLFVVSSKSGTTVEPMSLFRFFYEETGKVLRRRPRHLRRGTPREAMANDAAAGAGSRFVAITDPGTPLEALAFESGFRRVFSGDPNVGGRYSALTAFGLLPAALIGVDVAAVAESARRAARSSQPGSTGTIAALKFGLRMGDLARAGKDKLTFVFSPRLLSFGLWCEQLIAESTGKEGKGIVPVAGEEPVPPVRYGHDRFFVALRLKGEKEPGPPGFLKALRSAGHPVEAGALGRPEDIGGEFFKWEIAVAVVAARLGVNPFDQPDVQSAKDRTKRVLDSRGRRRTDAGAKMLRFSRGSWSVSSEVPGVKSAATPLSRHAPHGEGRPCGGRAAAVWEKFWKPARVIHLCVFLPERPVIAAALGRLRRRIFIGTGATVTAGFGPRYLHSTGQLHKGGPRNAACVVIAARRATRLRIPGEKFSFEELERAQAIGDFEALREKGRAALYIEGARPDAALLSSVERAFSALRPGLRGDNPFVARRAATEKGSDPFSYFCCLNSPVCNIVAMFSG